MTQILTDDGPISIVKLLQLLSNAGAVTGTPLAIADGGTGATDVTTARDNLGVEIGADVQAWAAWLDTLAAAANAAGTRTALDVYSTGSVDSALGGKQNLASNLTTLAGLSSIANLSTLAGLSALSANIQSFLQGADYAALRSLLSLVVGTNVQAWATKLDNFSALVGAADKLVYHTGANTFSTVDFPSFSRGVVNQTSAANWLSQLAAYSSSETDDAIELGDALLTRFLNASFVFAGGTFSTATDGTLVAPDGIEADELLVFVNFARSASSSPTLATPTGFTNFFNELTFVNTIRVACSYKKAAGTEGGTTLQGMDATGSLAAEVMALLRFKVKESWTSMSWGVSGVAGTLQITSSDPSQQTISIGSAATPAIGFSVFACGATGSLGNPSTGAPSQSAGKSFEYGETSGGFTSGRFYIMGNVQGDRFQDYTCDMGNQGADYNILLSFWGELVP